MRTRDHWHISALRSALAVGAGMVVLASCRAEEDPEPRPEPKAVVLLTIDTLRADTLPLIADTASSAPFLDSLAQDAVVFTQAYAPSSWTVPSVASLFTSVEPQSHGVLSGIFDIVHHPRGMLMRVQGQPLLPQSFITLAEAFRAAGYVTIGIPANMHLAEHLGFGQGFDSYFSEADFLVAPGVNAKVQVQLEHVFGADWRTAWKKQKTFLWIHYSDPHEPYFARRPWIYKEAPDFATDPSSYPAGWDNPDINEQYPQDPETAEQRILPLYRSEVSFVDENIRLLDEAIGLRDDDVLLVLTSDHGEEFYEHGRIGHSLALFEETIHVPMMWRWPRALPEPARLDTPASIMDIYPSLADLLGLDLPPGVHGTSLFGIVPGAPERTTPLYFHTSYEPPVLTAVREGLWKLIRTEGLPPSLFHVVDDADEQVDVASRHPEIVERLTAALDKHLASLPPPPDDTGTVELSPEDAEKLRDVGYGGD